MNRGGVSLRPGDGIIHSWLNRMLLPDTVGTGGDSYPPQWVFPFPSGFRSSGVCCSDRCDAIRYIPESVRVRFVKGEMQPGITLRDLVLRFGQTIKEGLLTVEKPVKKTYLTAVS